LPYGDIQGKNKTLETPRNDHFKNRPITREPV
jgi:hypothetical protein